MALMVPAMGELTTVSIFMAERTHRGWPFSTWREQRRASQMGVGQVMMKTDAQRSPNPFDAY